MNDGGVLMQLASSVVSNEITNYGRTLILLSIRDFKQLGQFNKALGRTNRKPGWALTRLAEQVVTP